MLRMDVRDADSKKKLKTVAISETNAIECIKRGILETAECARELKGKCITFADVHRDEYGNYTFLIVVEDKS